MRNLLKLGNELSLSELKGVYGGMMTGDGPAKYNQCGSDSDCNSGYCNATPNGNRCSSSRDLNDIAAEDL